MEFLPAVRPSMVRVCHDAVTNLASRLQEAETRIRNLINRPVPDNVVNIEVADTIYQFSRTADELAGQAVQVAQLAGRLRHQLEELDRA